MGERLHVGIVVQRSGFNSQLCHQSFFTKIKYKKGQNGYLATVTEGEPWVRGCMLAL